MDEGRFLIYRKFNQTWIRGVQVTATSRVEKVLGRILRGGLDTDVIEIEIISTEEVAMFHIIVVTAGEPFSTEQFPPPPAPPPVLPADPPLPQNQNQANFERWCSLL